MTKSFLFLNKIAKYKGEKKYLISKKEKTRI